MSASTEGIVFAIDGYPGMLEYMVETARRLTEHMLDQVLTKVEFEHACGWEEIAFKRGPDVSLDWFEQGAVPRYQKTGQRLAGAGTDIWYTDCYSDVHPVTPGILAGGLGTLFPFEVNSSGHPGKVLMQHPGPGSSVVSTGVKRHQF